MTEELDRRLQQLAQEQADAAPLPLEWDDVLDRSDATVEGHARRRWPAVAAATLLIVAGVAVISMVRSSDAPGPSTDTPITPSTTINSASPPTSTPTSTIEPVEPVVVALDPVVLVDGESVGDSWVTGLARTAGEFEELWNGIGLSGSVPEVDFESNVVVYFGPAESSSCRFGPLDAVVYDPETGRVFPVLDFEVRSTEGEERECTDDANPHAIVVEMRRDDLPSSAFEIWVENADPPACCVSNVIRVAAGELASESASTGEPPTTEVGVTQPDSCAASDALDAATEAMYWRMLVARTTGDMTALEGCIDSIPGVFDGTTPNCWTSCGGVVREFVADTFRSNPVVDIDGSEQQAWSFAVSYLTADGQRIDVLEVWTLTPSDSGVIVAVQSVEETFLSRDESAATINEFFDHITTQDWQAAARMIDDGAQNLDERPDLNRLEPASFTLPDIAAALAEWCALGCDTQPITPDDLTYDGLYGLDSVGERLEAAWFEGDYSILGLPTPTTETLAARFNKDAILSDETVTNDEYRTMFARLIECAESNGASEPIEVARFDELDQRFFYSISGLNIGAFNPCYDTDGREIDIAFQTDPERAATRIANYTIVAQCFDAAGYDYRTYFEQANQDSPEIDLPDIDELTINEIIQLSYSAGLTDDPTNETIITLCQNQ